MAAPAQVRSFWMDALRAELQHAPGPVTEAMVIDAVARQAAG
jgi:hypothetical protein